MQSTDEDVAKLESNFGDGREDSNNKWRNLHRQLGMICEEAEYITFSHK